MMTAVGEVLKGLAMPSRGNSIILPFAREWRAARLLTQQQLADRAGVNLWTVHRAEAGQPVQILSAQKLAFALGIGLKQFQIEPPVVDQFIEPPEWWLAEQEKKASEKRAKQPKKDEQS